MRHMLLICLTLLVSAGVISADKPIPQDTVRMETRSRERLEWNRQTLRVAYDRIGKKDPRWNEPAQEARELAARMFSQQIDPVIQLADIKSVYDESLEHLPSDDIRRSLYAMFCYLAGHYPAAHAQFQAFGNRLTTWTIFPNFSIETMKRVREETERIVARNPR